MAGRLAIGVAVAACFLTTGGLYAQGPASAAAPTVAAPNAYFGPGVCTDPFGTPDMYGNYSARKCGRRARRLSAAGRAARLSAAERLPAAIPNAARPRRSGRPNAYNDCNGMTSVERQSDDVGETPFEEILCRVARNVIFNVDYINWSIVEAEQRTDRCDADPCDVEPGAEPDRE